MVGRVLRAVILLTGAAALLGTATPARTLTFEDRVRAQEAIERVYYSHQIGATKPFDEEVPLSVIEAKVRRYMQLTATLEKYWGTTVTAVSLERELDRIAASTRMPERLIELYSALNNDPVLVLECLARPVLVERLARNFFSTDERIHATARQDAETVQTHLVTGMRLLRADDPQRVEIEFVRKPPPREAIRGSIHSDVKQMRAIKNEPVELESDDFDRRLAQAPSQIGQIGPVEEERESFIVQVLLERGKDRARVAIYSVEKVSWDDWSRSLRDRFSNGWIAAPTMFESEESILLPSPIVIAEPTRSASTLDSGCANTDAWSATPNSYLPGDRFGHSAVWTGSEMIIWGGQTSAGTLRTGGRYDPALDAWRSTSTVGAPLARNSHSAVWAGNVMVVFGGLLNSCCTTTNTGGQYDPITDTWTSMSTVNAPPGGKLFWNGSLVITSSLSQYNPVTDQWGSISHAVPIPPLSFANVAWTGSRMIFWGGLDSNQNYRDDGAVYDSTTDSWSVMSTIGAPSGRTNATAVWSGTEMIVWGGQNASGTLNTGARYNLAANQWTLMSPTNLPPRYDSLAIWTGTEMVTYLGHDGGYMWNSGSRYNPVTDTWTPISLINSPFPWLSDPTAVWTGSLMLVSSGTTGARYNPDSDSWTPTTTFKLEARYGHAAVWTGSQMLVWGGDATGPSLPRYGARFDPALDYWTPISSINAPSSPSPGVTAVWTGTWMIAWGGYERNTGGRYDPITDTWSPTTTVNAPLGRQQPKALWTGTRMIIWGGNIANDPQLNTGAMYDPSGDSWTPISQLNAPPPTSDYSVVWDGSEMLMWGGYVYDGTANVMVNNGYRFNPSTNVWSATSTINAPEARSGHAAVWSGRQMVVWGGGNGHVYLTTGGRYDPLTDSWRATSTDNAPSGRSGHTANWTGTLMIVWGGSNGTQLVTGGQYHPLADTWAPTTALNPPLGREQHTSIWTGDSMIVWGGLRGCCTASSSGGVYSPDSSPDADSDTVSVCLGDCDDSNAAVFPSALQVCGDGLNNDCRLPSWPSLSGTNEGDDDGDGITECGGDCDPNDGHTYPGAPEFNDGKDNQCAGDSDFGVVDEVSGIAGFGDILDSERFCWMPQEGAEVYQVARADDPQFTSGCTPFLATTGACYSDSQNPSPGRAFFYLVRSARPNIGSWGQDSSGTERTSPCFIPSPTYSFSDTMGDDTADTSLRDFFADANPTPSSYIYFEVGGSPTGGAWCSERADFYRQSYLALAPTHGTIGSGAWNKWFRGASGSWSGPTTDGNLNYYGSDCLETWSWCSEYGLGGLLLDVRPAGPPFCEIEDDNTLCSGAGWQLTIRISQDRMLACGF